MDRERRNYTAFINFGFFNYAFPQFMIILAVASLIVGILNLNEKKKK